MTIATDDPRFHKTIGEIRLALLIGTFFLAGCFFSSLYCLVIHREALNVSAMMDESLRIIAEASRQMAETTEWNVCDGLASDVLTTCASKNDSCQAYVTIYEKYCSSIGSL
jgi:hypothetical protein